MLIWRLGTESGLEVGNRNIPVDGSYRSTGLVDEQRDSCAGPGRGPPLVVQDPLDAAQALAQLSPTGHSCSVTDSEVLQANTTEQISGFVPIHGFSTDLQHGSGTRPWNDSQNLLGKIKWNRQCRRG